MPASRPHPSPAVSRASSSEMPNVQQINAASGGMPASRPYASPAVSRMSSSEMPNVEPLASKQVQARAQTSSAAEEPDTAKARMRAHLQTVARMSVSYARQRLRKMSHTTNDSVVASLKQDVVLSIGGTLGLRWKRCHWGKKRCSTWNTPQSRYWRRPPGEPVSRVKLYAVITCSGSSSADSATVRTLWPPTRICASPVRARCTPKVCSA